MNGCCHAIPEHTETNVVQFGPQMFGTHLADILAPYERPDHTGHAFLPSFLERSLRPLANGDVSDRNPQFEVADIFRRYGEAYRATHRLTIRQLNVMHAVENCRTAAYGFHTDVCDTCGHIESAYNSCRDRHCPKCQGIAKRKWVNARIDELLPIAYHHATFTLPGELSLQSLYNRKLIYDLLFDAAAQTLLTFGRDEKHLGAQIGFYGILHTWSQTLWPHAHLHLIVTAGGLTDDGRWIEPKYKTKFLFPVKALSKVFRGKFIQGLKKAWYAGALILTDDMGIDNATAFEMWVDRLVARDWVVHSKAPFSGPEEVVRYIGRYTHRVAISNHRILSISDGQICFTYKDNKEKDKDKLWKEMTLPADQFITRFLWHIPPKGFHRIRHYGFLNNGQKHSNIAHIREIMASLEQGPDSGEAAANDETVGMPCPECVNGRMRPFLITDGSGQILKCDITVFSTHPERKYDDSS